MEASSLTPLCQFHSLHRHLDISREITADSTDSADSTADTIDSSSRGQTRKESLVCERKSQITKLHALNSHCCK